MIYTVPKNNPQKTEPVTAGADAIVCVCFLSSYRAEKKHCCTMQLHYPQKFKFLMRKFILILGLCISQCPSFKDT